MPRTRCAASSLSKAFETNLAATSLAVPADSQNRTPSGKEPLPPMVPSSAARRDAEPLKPEAYAPQKILVAVLERAAGPF